VALLDWLSLSGTRAGSVGATAWMQRLGAAASRL